MKYPGQPADAPSWYRDRSQSHIEAEFSKELNELADLIESEQWFGDKAKHARYRVDFILRDARLIIELDGHAYHSSPEQLEKDAIRQRYLTRSGYTVIRFTGREINRDAKGCVDEVRTIYRERMQREPVKYRAMYIDYRFFYQERMKAINFFRKINPEKTLTLPSIDQVIPHAIEWLYEKSFITAFIFHLPEDGYEIEHLNGLTLDYEKGEVRINTISEEWYSLELGEHMLRFAHLFDEFLVIADDPVYVSPLLSVLPNEMSVDKLGDIEFSYIGNGKLLRRGNNETSYIGSDLVRVKWQNVWYVLGAAMGLSIYEM
ncbi:TPA: endonuclease domain-containing protein [Vibrio diabolicus]